MHLCQCLPYTWRFLLWTKAKSMQNLLLSKVKPQFSNIEDTCFFKLLYFFLKRNKETPPLKHGKEHFSPFLSDLKCEFLWRLMAILTLISFFVFLLSSSCIQWSEPDPYNCRVCYSGSDSLGCCYWLPSQWKVRKKSSVFCTLQIFFVLSCPPTFIWPAVFGARFF